MTFLYNSASDVNNEAAVANAAVQQLSNAPGEGAPDPTQMANWTNFLNSWNSWLSTRNANQSAASQGGGIFGALQGDIVLIENQAPDPGGWAQLYSFEQQLAQFQNEYNNLDPGTGAGTGQQVPVITPNAGTPLVQTILIGAAAVYAASVLYPILSGTSSLIGTGEQIENRRLKRRNPRRRRGRR